MTRQRDDPEEFDGQRLRNNLPPSTPWWVRVGLMGGLAPVVLVLLVGIYTGWIRVPLPPPSNATAVIADVLLEHDRKADQLIARLTKALQIVCENQAQTAAQHRNCGNIQ